MVVRLYAGYVYEILDAVSVTLRGDVVVDTGISSRLVVDDHGYEGFGSCAFLLVTTATYKR